MLAFCRVVLRVQRLVLGGNPFAPFRCSFPVSAGARAGRQRHRRRRQWRRCEGVGAKRIRGVVWNREEALALLARMLNERGLVVRSGRIFARNGNHFVRRFCKVREPDVRTILPEQFKCRAAVGSLPPGVAH